MIKYLFYWVILFIMFFLMVGGLYSLAGVSTNIEVLFYQALGFSSSATVLRWCCK